MYTIWKYAILVNAENTLYLTEGYEILDVQVQDDLPCLWVKVNPSATKVKVTINTYGTGHPVPEKTGQYVGTYQYHGLVFHVFKSE